MPASFLSDSCGFLALLVMISCLFKVWREGGWQTVASSSSIITITESGSNFFGPDVSGEDPFWAKHKWQSNLEKPWEQNDKFTGLHSWHWSLDFPWGHSLLWRPVFTAGGGGGGALSRPRRRARLLKLSRVDKLCHFGCLFFHKTYTC